MTTVTRRLDTPTLPWTIAVIVSALAFYVWGSSLEWRFAGLSPYQLFPLFGLLAFSLMWGHYVVGMLCRLFLDRGKLDDYFRLTGYAVLVLILLHPGILVYQRFRDGFGLPPHSYETYVAPGLAWVTLLGTVSLLIFLAFELHRWFKDASWWKYVAAAGDLAMLAVFYHGLELGTHTHVQWFRVVWYFYGVTLVGCLLYKYWFILRKRDKVGA
ncbi:MAG TPA: DUF2127 domain-containing protein [Candidatus Saccharimonadales bacterium]|nr:DUF2127 domain-containing protein [Candidatus Saccharimonadales bacterium]